VGCKHPRAGEGGTVTAAHALAFEEGFFWPIVSIVVWGAVLAIWCYRIYRGNVDTEEQIQREMKMLP
jgi:hypothetical protein